MKTREKIGKGTLLVADRDLKYIEFECLNKYSDKLLHCMSTRLGGVSTGECSTLNLGFNRRDGRENVYENYNRFCKSTGINPESMVLTNQIHETKVSLAGCEDMGKGYSRESDLIGVDGLLTITRGVTIVTFHADCIPVYLYEPQINAAALLHSGWRGTLKNIVSEALIEMSKLPGFQADKLVAVIGPSIRSCCFEAGNDVYELFFEKYPDIEYYKPVSEGKWLIDLQGIIKAQMLKSGLQDINIHDSEICTKCRNDLFFSYRGDRGKTGSLAAFMQLI